jgi:hypothetical protein
MCFFGYVDVDVDVDDVYIAISILSSPLNVKMRLSCMQNNKNNQVSVLWQGVRFVNSEP